MSSHFENLLSVPQMAKEWREIRLTVLGSKGDYNREGREAEEVSRVPVRQQSAVLSKIFSKSKELGERVSRDLGRALTLSEITEFLEGAGIPCFTGRWKKESAALSRYLYRGECRSISALFCCDYWREAARGLVLGLNSAIEFARHRSLGHGNSSCLDYVFVKPGIERSLGVVPRDIQTALGPIRRQLSRRKIELVLKGLSEDTLFVEVERAGFPLDHEERILIMDQLHSGSKTHFPFLKIVELGRAALLEGAFGERIESTYDITGRDESE